jgi:Arv1-like family
MISSDVNGEISERRYRCITCLQRCGSLCCHYGNKSSELNSKDVASSRNKTLRLNRCIACHQTIDPYCERESLLVVLDLILLRQESYRHVLCNDGRISNGILVGRDFPLFLTYIVLSCLESSFHQLQTLKPLHGRMLLNDEKQLNLIAGLTEHFYRSFSGSIVFISTVMILSFCLIKNNDDCHRINGMTLYSIIYPLLGCQMASCLVAIWDDSKATRIVGCLVLPLIYQWMALYQTMLVASVRINLCHDNQTKVNTFLRVLKTSFILAVAITIKVAIVSVDY